MRQIVGILIKRPSGELFVHQRSAGKKIYAKLFGLGAGGAVEAGEEPIDAAKRELKEETNINADPAFIMSFEFINEGVVYRVHWFEVVTSFEPQIAHDEWQWMDWLSIEDVKTLRKDNKLCPDTAEFFDRYVVDL